MKKNKINADADYNHAYYPIIFENEEILLKTISELEGHNIFPRRYFYPSLSALNYVNKYSTPVSDDIAKRILCLPVYYKMPLEVLDMIVRVILRTKNY